MGTPQHVLEDGVSSMTRHKKFSTGKMLPPPKETPAKFGVEHSADIFKSIITHFIHLIGEIKN